MAEPRRPGPRPKPAGERYEALTIRLPPRDAERLREAARVRGLSLGAVVLASLELLEGSASAHARE